MSRKQKAIEEKHRSSRVKYLKFPSTTKPLINNNLRDCTVNDLREYVTNYKDSIFYYKTWQSKNWELQRDECISKAWKRAAKEITVQTDEFYDLLLKYAIEELKVMLCPLVKAMK